jgi:hypothetical protein
VDERACVASSKKTVSSWFRTTFDALKVFVLNKDASQDGGVLASCGDFQNMRCCCCRSGLFASFHSSVITRTQYLQCGLLDYLSQGVERDQMQWHTQ